MNNLEKEFVPYTEALELKQLGFDEPCFGWYASDKSLVKDYVIKMNLIAPTFSQAFRWFREKGYDVKVQKESAGLYFGFYWTGAAWITVGTGSYEEAELSCLRKLIEIVKQKQQ